MSKPRPRTMHEFSDATGLSRPTVSKYFQDPGSVRATTRARIERAMAELDYRPNFFALNQNRRTSKTVGILVPQLLDPFYAEIVRRIEGRAVEAGFWPILLSSHGSPELEARAVDTLRSLKVAGALVAPLGDASDAGALERLGVEVPVVLFDTWIDGPFAFVGTDNAHSIGQMVAYLCATGSPPCFLGFPEFNSTSRDRREAYVGAMRARGVHPFVLPLPDVGRDRAGWDRAGGGDGEGGDAGRDFERLGFEATRAALGRGGFPSGTVLCANDRLAIGVLAAAFAAGVKVGPGLDLRVAGHDDHPLSRFTCPALTTVSQDYARLSEVALDTLLAMTGRQDAEEPRVHRLASTLIPRASA